MRVISLGVALVAMETATCLCSALSRPTTTMFQIVQLLPADGSPSMREVDFYGRKFEKFFLDQVIIGGEDGLITVIDPAGNNLSAEESFLAQHQTDQSVIQVGFAEGLEKCRFC